MPLCLSQFASFTCLHLFFHNKFHIKLGLKPHNSKTFWPQSSSTVCHVIHQALMMVIRNQFGTTVESCQSIMFNVVIHMKREKERLAMIYDTRMAYNVIINNRFVKFQPSINVQLGIYYPDQFCLTKKQLSQQLCN